jgi:WD40 repeat protein
MTIDRHAHRAATVDVDGHLRVWDLMRGRSREIVLRGTKCTSAAIDSSGNQVVIGSEDGVLRVWHHGLRFRRILGRHAASIRRITLDAVGARAIAASEDGEIRLWDLRAGTSQLLEPNPINRGRWHSSGGVAFDAELASVAMVWWEKWIRVWDIDRGRWTLLEVPTSTVRCAQAHGPSGNVVFSTEDGWIRSWNARDKKMLPIGRHDADRYDPIAAIAPIWEKGLVVSASKDASIRVWSLDAAHDWTQEPLLRFSNDLGAEFTALAVRGEVLIAGDSDGRVHCVRLEVSTPK